MKTALPTVDASLFSPAEYHGPPAVPGVVWHYTNSHAAKRIITAGALTPQPQRYLDRDPPPGTKPLLWFSKNHIFEPCSLHSCAGFTFEWNGERIPKSFTFEGAQSFGTRLVRIAVPAELAPYGHHACFRLAGYGTKQSRWLEHVGEQLGGNLDDWRGTLESVPATCWLSVEIWHGLSCRWELGWES